MNRKNLSIKQFLIFSVIYLSQLSIAYSDQDELTGLSVEDLLYAEGISVATETKPDLLWYLLPVSAYIACFFFCSQFIIISFYDY
jgi:hypothetical protein